MTGAEARAERRAARAIVLGPGAGRAVPGAEGITLLATSEQTGGAVGVLEATGAPGSGPAPHIHHDHDELFYVLEGEFRFLVGETTALAPAGSFVFVPRGTVHAARCVGAGPGRVLAAYLPGGPELAFAAFARASAAERDAVAEQFRSTFVQVPPERGA